MANGGSTMQRSFSHVADAGTAPSSVRCSAACGHDSPGRPRRWVHGTGVAWLTACLAALVQAALGQRPFEESALSMVIVFGVVGWGAVALRAAGAMVHAPAWRTP